MNAFGTIGTGTFGTHTYTASIAYGNPVWVWLGAETTAEAGVMTSYYEASIAKAGFAADLGHTVSWGGIRELRRADGSHVTGFSALSADTGFDYTQAWTAAPVPEPGTMALWLAGLAFVGGCARRRMHQVA